MPACSLLDSAFPSPAPTLQVSASSSRMLSACRLRGDPVLVEKISVGDGARHCTELGESEKLELGKMEGWRDRGKEEGGKRRREGRGSEGGKGRKGRGREGREEGEEGR
eukprot:211526-Hanusia_phi.AAC.2